MKTYTENEWMVEGTRLFGPDRKDWKFKCISCKTVQSARDFVEKATDPEAMKETLQRGIVGFSCIGRFINGTGCDWTLGGFLTIHNTQVIANDGHKVPVFEFAS